MLLKNEAMLFGLKLGLEPISAKTLFKNWTQHQTSISQQS